MMNMPIPILLVEDEPLWQKAVQDLLATNAHFALSAICEDFDAAMKAFQDVRPQMALLDWQIKGLKDGLAVGDALLQKGLRPEQIVLISGSSPSSIPPHPFLYIPKNRISEDLMPLLESVTIH